MVRPLLRGSSQNYPGDIRKSNECRPGIFFAILRLFYEKFLGAEEVETGGQKTEI